MEEKSGAHQGPEGVFGIYTRQVIALCHKNLKLFLRRPLVMIIRVLLVPIAITLLVSEFKHIGTSVGGFGNDDSGISDLRPIKTIAQALEGHEDTKFVFARNGFGSRVDPVIDRFAQQNPAANVIKVDNATDIIKECRVTLAGASDCFTAVIFHKVNDTFFDYILSVNPSDFSGDSDWRSHKSTIQDRVWPTQFALDAAIAEFPETTIVNEQSYKEDLSSYFKYYDDLYSGGDDNDGDTTSTGEKAEANTNGYYYFVTYFLAPFFFMIFIEMVFHVCGFLTRERESGVTELLTTQGCRQTPQIASYFSSFWLLYLPTWIITGIILGVVLFTTTNTGYLVLFQVLAGTATLCMCVFLSTLFTKGHFSSPVSAIITLALAMIIFNYLFKEKPSQTEMSALSAVFPPFAYASLIADIARLESVTRPFDITRSAADIKILTLFRSFSPYLYIVYFLIQIPLYLGLAVASHFAIWHVPYIVTKVAPESGLAMKTTGLSKTFKKSKGRAVNELSVEVRRGQVVSLLGPNGAGKTTALKCIGGVVKADKGSQIELGCERTQLGYCPQHNVIWPQLTVREHVQIWLGIKGRKMSKDEQEAAIESMIRECDLVEKRDAQAGTLSGGQKRKLQLAIAFIGGSQIICIDEASSGVDPLSRQNIWQIIQQGVAHRTILLTTHFLDEADILSDYIIIMSKGKLVVEGSSTALKAAHGDGYSIYADHTMSNKLAHTKTSEEASQKLEEWAREDEAAVSKYEVAFPTLEQVFLKVAAGDALGEESENAEESGEETTTAATAARENPAQNLDQGRPISKFRQIWVLFKKRYSVIPHNWLAIVVTLAIPIAVAAAVMKGTGTVDDYGLQNCAANIEKFANRTNALRTSAALSASASARLATATVRSTATTTQSLYSYRTYGPADYQPFYDPIDESSYPTMYEQDKLVLGPESVFRPRTEGYKIVEELFPVVYGYDNVDNAKKPISDNIIYVNNVDNYTKTLPGALAMVDYSYSTKYVGIWFPNGETPRIAMIGQDSSYSAFYAVDTLATVDNMLSDANNGPDIRASVRTLRRVESSYDFLAVPFALFITMAVIAGFTAAIIYPTYERVQKTRSLQYSNGVSPLSLWSAYFLFELQLILIVAIIMYALLSVGEYTKLFFGLGYIFGAILLTGVATVLGCYILSLYFSAKMAYFMAIVIHLVLLLLYFVGVVLAATYAPPLHRYEVQNQLAAGLGLSSPAANLARALMIGTNAYSLLCGKYGEIPTPSSAFAFNLYGGVYFNLILQIVFLFALLMAIEYSLFSRIYYRFRRPTIQKSRDSMELELASPAGITTRKSAAETVSPDDKPLLECFSLHKSFKGTEAVHDVTLSVSSNETMALLGPNGAGKSTTINMIRGQFKPDSGDIFVRDKSVLSQLVEARAETGVCPQEDAVDDLTVFSTLKFYAEIRGVPDPNRNAQLVMEALGIQDFKSKRVSKLSGGTKRKLSVAIALLGNPPVLLLDEPSTGLDAVSKRTLWKTLRALGKDRATLLTTHSMEEVEALATSVSIIAVKLLASGTTSGLRDQYGGFWHVRAVVKPETSGEAEKGVKSAFGSSLEELVVHGGNAQIRFGVKKSGGAEGWNFMKVMREMEAMKKDGRIMEYSLNGTTLQEVFLNVCSQEKSTN
ncbi:hypothetical protein TWF106_005125 [Orbilia oligospora]|uniref:ABC transporter domain-containing protein n=1 Tax=Orbilia oligospora TaxID=2813651 RepID=A0A6G1MDI3_ORBOL|nr:hypothetical protein TWF788_007901 [Orbilia oligospora]KAF3217086.1 hypothetical protein TWF191_008765 [Orbilia oligospora]KAF3222461.1 hypothetical protein TWF679_005940 [Orbilia oligospora]KAF3223352.1 hypothetical protein TWF106_005125 [Orbilia oligospora]KAF3253581.1 hypothetical protein TWF192_003834 [Orbilia oligospora]